MHAHAKALIAGRVGSSSRSRSRGAARRRKMVSYPSGSETVSGYLAVPTAPGRSPAIVVIHEWWGLNDWVEGEGRRFAKQGYVALAADLYRGKVATDADTAHQLMRGHAGGPRDAGPEGGGRVSARAAGRRPRAVAVVGWCMGGGYCARARARRADARRRRHLLRAPRHRAGDDRSASRCRSSATSADRTRGFRRTPCARSRQGREAGGQERGLQDLSRTPATPSRRRSDPKVFRPRTRRTPTRGPTRSSRDLKGE